MLQIWQRGVNPHLQKICQVSGFGESLLTEVTFRSKSNELALLPENSGEAGQCITGFQERKQ